MRDKEHEVLASCDGEGSVDYRPATSFMLLFFLGFLLVSFALAVYVVAMKTDKIVTDKTSLMDVLQGRTAFTFEKKFEEELPIRDAVIGTFGALTYGVFHTGRDGVVLGQDGWFFSKEEFEALKGAQTAEQSKLVFMKDVNAFLKKKNITLVVALIPAKARVYEEKLGNVMLPESRRGTYDRFLKAVHEMGIVAPNLEVVLREAKSSGDMFMHTDTHWTPAGAQLVAKAVAEAIAVDAKIEITPKEIYTTTLGEEKPYDGDLLRYVKTGVFRSLIGPVGEKVNARSTESVSSNAAPSGDLFGDKIVPVVLVGTSYSAQKDWHFDGFLKAAMGADVLNVADEGKGPVQPMVDYLKKTDFSTSAPKVVIWEIPERFISKTYDIKLPDVSGDVVKDVK